MSSSESKSSLVTRVRHLGASEEEEGNPTSVNGNGLCIVHVCGTVLYGVPP
jgi:hypothetical protein